MHARGEYFTYAYWLECNVCRRMMPSMSSVGHSKAKGDSYKTIANCGRGGGMGGMRSGTSHDNGRPCQDHW